MYRLLIDQEACKACGYCIHFCPKQALSFADCLNKQSYTPVQVDAQSCVHCGTCCIVCPDTVFSIIETRDTE